MRPEQPPGPPPRADYQRAAQDAMQTAKAAAKDAFATFMKLIYNPVGALPEAYAALAPTQAIGVGVVFAVVAVVCLLVSGGGVLSMVGGGALSLGFKGFVIGLGATLGAAAGIAAGSWLSRLLLRGEGNLAFDIFIGGATLATAGSGHARQLSARSGRHRRRHRPVATAGRPQSHGAGGVHRAGARGWHQGRPGQLPGRGRAGGGMLVAYLITRVLVGVLY
jgi:hypothetical protein